MSSQRLDKENNEKIIGPPSVPPLPPFRNGLPIRPGLGLGPGPGPGPGPAAPGPGAAAPGAPTPNSGPGPGLQGPPMVCIA